MAVTIPERMGYASHPRWGTSSATWAAIVRGTLRSDHHWVTRFAQHAKAGEAPLGHAIRWCDSHLMIIVLRAVESNGHKSELAWQMGHHQGS